MQPKPIRFFIVSAGVILTVTAIAKLVSSFGDARILEIPDPIASLSFRTLFRMVALLELGVALVCFFGRRPVLQAALVAWMSVNFLVYRLGLIWVGYHRPCSCLGNLTDALHVRPEVADAAMKIVLAYLLAGSFGALAWLWQLRRNIPTPPGASSVAA